jgi:hypothetical protein
MGFLDKGMFGVSLQFDALYGFLRRTEEIERNTQIVLHFQNQRRDYILATEKGAQIGRRHAGVALRLNFFWF